MSPSLILIIVNKEHSIVNSFGFRDVLFSNPNGESHANGAGHHPASIGHIIFAKHTKGTIDNEQSPSPRHSTISAVPDGLQSRDSESCLP